MLSSPLIQKMLFCQILYMKQGFKLKFIEQVNDEIGKERDMAMRQQVWRPPNESQDETIRDRQFNEERKRVKQELEDLPEVEDFIQLKNIAADYISF